MNVIDDRTPDEALAEQLVDRALAKLAVPPDLVPALRVTMIGNLLQTPQGREQLRRARPDPVVFESGDVAKPSLERLAQVANEMAKRQPRRGKK